MKITFVLATIVAFVSAQDACWQNCHISADTCHSRCWKANNIPQCHDDCNQDLVDCRNKCNSSLKHIYKIKVSSYVNSAISLVKLIEY